MNERCERCGGMFVGRYAEELSCLNCGATPPLSDEEAAVAKTLAERMLRPDGRGRRIKSGNIRL